MEKGISKYITAAVFIAVLAGFFILNLVIDTPAILESERRPPASFPKLTAKSFADDSFMKGFDEWAQDGFTFRENLRTLRAIMVFHVFQQTDKEGLYIGDTGIGQFRKIDEQAWRQTIGKVNRMAERLQDGSREFNMYIAVIPDKSLYAGRFLPGYDAGTARRLIEEELSPAITAIDLHDSLSAGDFYRTDLHWSQPMTGDVMDELGSAMGFESILKADSTGNSVNIAGEFRGAYAGQIALPIEPDAIEYVINEYIESAGTSYLDPKTQAFQPGEMYYHEALTRGGDPYDFFLNGPQPLIVLESHQGESAVSDDGRPVGRTLYLFRDSFGSSLGPLFLGAYDRVVLIDLRYIDSRILPEFVDFEPGSDVLFLYSSQIFGSPGTMLVS